MVNTIIKDGSIFSGILIGFAGWIFISVGGGILGAILFAIGLLAVVYSGTSLYTGKAGSWTFKFYSLGSDTWGLLKILIGNIVGCLIVAWISRLSGTLNTEFLASVIECRENSDSLETIARSIGCGFLMELAVYIWREKSSVLGVLFCVPSFILSGFFHSVADAFYYLAYGNFETWMISVYLLTVLGNFIGCSIRRVFIPYK